jgi:hypothetical protein
MPRLLLQYLEPSEAVKRADAADLAEYLADALRRLPVTDLALGWELSPAVIDAVRPLVPARVTLWRWVPMLTDSGTGRPVDARIAIGIDGRPPAPFRDMAAFRFLCLDHDEVVEAGLARAISLVREVDGDGVLLDRIRWHSPSRSPVSELTCFCERSRAAAAEDGLDLGAVAGEVELASPSLDGRRSVVAALLGGESDGPMAEFLAWRSRRVTEVVGRFSEGLRDVGLRSALDVFTPALAGSVGQDLRALGGLGAWAKSMTYVDALGPASMPFELRGYAAWLEEAGEVDTTGFLSGLIGFEAPGVGGRGQQLEALRVETDRLSDAVGQERAVLGLDAVEIPGVCDIADADLAARIGAVREAGVGLAPSWELLFISGHRSDLIKMTWSDRH